MGGEERKSAVAERRKVLLMQILALDVPAEDQGYVTIQQSVAAFLHFSFNLRLFDERETRLSA